jgi:hypothetical protein
LITKERKKERERDVSVNHTHLLHSYRTIGMPIHGKVTQTLNDEEKYPVEQVSERSLLFDHPSPDDILSISLSSLQIIIDDSFGPLGPGGTRALMTALMGSGPGMKGGPFKLLKSIRIWRSNVGDDGAASIVSAVRCSGWRCMSVLFLLRIDID